MINAANRQWLHIRRLNPLGEAAYRERPQRGAAVAVASFVFSAVTRTISSIDDATACCPTGSSRMRPMRKLPVAPTCRSVCILNYRNQLDADSKSEHDPRRPALGPEGRFA